MQQVRDELMMYISVNLQYAVSRKAHIPNPEKAR